MLRARSLQSSLRICAKTNNSMTNNHAHLITTSTNYSKLALFDGIFKNAPKGFEKYFRNTNQKKGSSGGDPNKPSGKSGSDQSSGGNGGSGGGNDQKNKKSGGNPNRKPENETESLLRIMVVSTMGLVAYYLLTDETTRYGREINWQEFQKTLLETGQVDRIVVTNKNIAKVIMRAKTTEDFQSGDKDLFAEQSSSASNWPSSSDMNAQQQQQQDPYGNNSQPGNGNNDEQQRFNHPNHHHPVFAPRYPSLGSPVSGPAQYYFNIGTVESFERKLEEAQKSLGIAPKDFIPVVYVTETHWGQELFRTLLPTALIIGGMYYLSRGVTGSSGGGPGNIFRIGKSTAKKINKENVKTTFTDVAGCDEAKREIMEFVQFLKDPKRFTDLGAKIPKGALLCGPPGTGKTLLAKATAGEANVPFFSISGSDFVEMFVGVGPSRVRDLFKEARENAPCIIFIDEIDAVGRQRGRGGFSGGNDERENTLNQLLVEMDGFDSTANIVVFAATNRVDILDQALTRPGRFDRQITVDKPDIKGRKSIFEIYLKTLQIADKVEDYSSRLAALTPGFVGADIANICNEAAIIAARRNKKAIDLSDFESATDRVIGGLESRKIMSPEEKRVVAYHEAGHAVAGWYMEHADPLLKVTIVPRGSGALGFAQYLPKELFLRTKDQILDMVCMALAGRAAEQVNFGRVTTGAADDLRRVTQIVYQMVQVYGMNAKIGQVSFPKDDSQWPQDRLYSNATAEVIDEEVRNIVDEAYKRTLKLMEDKKEDVQKVAELLLSKETITNTDISEIIGARPHSAGKDYEEYLQSGWKVKKPQPIPEATAAGAAETVKEDKDSNNKKDETITPENLSPA